MIKISSKCFIKDAILLFRNMLEKKKTRMLPDYYIHKTLRLKGKLMNRVNGCDFISQGPLKVICLLCAMVVVLPFLMEQSNSSIMILCY